MIEYLLYNVGSKWPYWGSGLLLSAASYAAGLNSVGTYLLAYTLGAMMGMAVVYYEDGERE